MKTLFVLVALLVACSGPSAPRFYSISSEFGAAERETIAAAVEAWCEATGDCPELSMFSEEAHFELVDDLSEKGGAPCPEGFTCTTNGRESDGRIRIARNRAPGLDVLWRIAAHEYGHLCIDGHREDSILMSAFQTVEGKPEVDAAAVEAWDEGCH